MNIILFQPDELDKPLSIDDERTLHIIKILKSKPGDILKGGIVNQSYIDLKIEKMDYQGIHFSYRENRRKPPHCFPLSFIIGAPRPPTARRLIKDLTTLGVSNMIFTDTDLNEKSYLSSKLWQKELYREALIEGAQQAGTTMLPWINRFYSLKKSLESLPEDLPGIFLEANADAIGLNDFIRNRSIGGPLAIALGPERGWTEREITMLKDFGFINVQMGERILRTETAAIGTAHMVIQSLFI